MSIIFIDGVSHYGTGDLPKKGWGPGSNGFYSVSAALGRRGGGAFVPGSLPGALRVFSARAGLVFGQAFYATGYPGATNPAGFLIVGYFDGSTLESSMQLALTINSLGQFMIRRGATLVATSAYQVPLNTWVFIEFKVVFSNTGSYEVRVNGTTVMSGSGVDTTATANNTASALMFGYTVAVATSIDERRCDFYLLDTAGAAPHNDFLGDIRIDTLFPNADGAYSAMTPSAAGAHYLLVDEATPNTTDYVEGLNVGDRDSYQLQDLPALTSQTVYAVQAVMAAMKDDSGAKSGAPFVRSGGVNGDGAAYPLSAASLSFVTHVAEKNPNGTVAWTEATVNSMEIGGVVLA